MENIPLCRTRRFWAVIYSLMLVWSVFFYFWAFSITADSSVLRIVNELAMSLGASFWGMWGRVFFDQIGAIVGFFIYFISQTYLLAKTIKSSDVQLRYPILFSLNYLAGMAMLLFFLGGLT